MTHDGRGGAEAHTAAAEMERYQVMVPLPWMS